ncbi:hypothetical protein PVK06_041464 [Gossypium arboreum]|uniref:Uncharacterized protein n=1 Tax=Gossypium arboreum TaxID=29729 RepID=A0ABR0N892_GOSAR|nr:hypothetical protein PVK06_041464 [Gossypium arboreum]
MSALQLIKEKAQKDGKKKNEETISRVIEAAVSVDCCFHFTVLMVAGDVSVMPDVSVDLVTNAVEGVSSSRTTA